MLVLSRFPRQVIRIGEEIEVHVHDVDPRTGRVWLGIVAPRDVRVLREELWREQQQHNARALELSLAVAGGE